MKLRISKLLFDTVSVFSVDICFKVTLSDPKKMGSVTEKKEKVLSVYILS